MLIVVRNSVKNNENRLLSQRISNCRTQLFCGLICHALDQKVEGSNLITAKARGSSTGSSPGGPIKVKACKSLKTPL